MCSGIIQSMTTYRTGTHHGITICVEGDGQICDRPGHDCARGHLVAVIVNGDLALAERIAALLNAEQQQQVATWTCSAEIHSWERFTPEQVDSYYIRCTVRGPHMQHEDAHTGLTWRAEA